MSDGALQLDERDQGRLSRLWAPGGFARRYAFFIAIAGGSSLLFSAKPLTLWRIVAELAVVAVLGAGGGAFLGRLIWRSGEQNYQKQLALARASAEK